MENSNSNTNQSIKERFVSREVLTCFSYEMDEIMAEGIVTYDDIENCYENVCPECRSDDIHYDEDGETWRCEDCDTLHDTPESRPVEIMEWWIVTDYLHKKLSEKVNQFWNGAIIVIGADVVQVRLYCLIMSYQKFVMIWKF